LLIPSALVPPLPSLPLPLSLSQEAGRLEQNLQRQGFNCLGIHGDKGQNDRIAAIEKFKTKEVPLLIATDVAARGLDIPDVEVVINYSFPLTIEDYVHRYWRRGGEKQARKGGREEGRKEGRKGETERETLIAPLPSLLPSFPSSLPPGLVVPAVPARRVSRTPSFTKATRGMPARSSTH